MRRAISTTPCSTVGSLDPDVADGINETAFRKGVYQVFIQNDILAKKIFEHIDYNFSHFMNWSEFISGMQMIKAKTLADKIGLFITLADEDHNGLLSMHEVRHFCRACISRYIKPDYEGFEEAMVEYFAKFIFQSMGIDEHREIPLKDIKQHILQGKEGSHLLAMFCGADF